MKYIAIVLVIITAGIAILMIVKSRPAQQPASELPLPAKSIGSTYPYFVFAKIFDPVLPMDRGSKYEDPLDELS